MQNVTTESHLLSISLGWVGSLGGIETWVKKGFSMGYYVKAKVSISKTVTKEPCTKQRKTPRSQHVFVVVHGDR